MVKDGLEARAEFRGCSWRRGVQLVFAQGQWWEQGPSLLRSSGDSGFSSEWNGSIAGLDRGVTHLHMWFTALSLAAALRIFKWYWVCNMLSTLLWVNRWTTYDIKNQDSRESRMWGWWSILLGSQGPSESVCFFSCFWSIRASRGSDHLPQQTLSHATATLDGFRATGYTWPGLGCYLF